MKINLGKVSVTPRTDFTQGVTVCARLDIVRYEGSGYLSLVDDNTDPVSDTSKWMCLVEKGDPFVYEDFTEEQLAALQLPATEAAETVEAMIGVYNQAVIDFNAAESNRVTAESNRVTAESNRVTAESNRVSAESARVSAESTRSSHDDAYVQNEHSNQQLLNHSSPIPQVLQQSPALCCKNFFLFA